MADESTLTKHIWNEQNIVLSNFGFDFTGQIENESRTLVRFNNLILTRSATAAHKA